MSDMVAPYAGGVENSAGGVFVTSAGDQGELNPVLLVFLGDAETEQAYRNRPRVATGGVTRLITSLALDKDNKVIEGAMVGVECGVENNGEVDIHLTASITLPIYVLRDWLRFIFEEKPKELHIMLIATDQGERDNQEIISSPDVLTMDLGDVETSLATLHRAYQTMLEHDKVHDLIYGEYPDLKEAILLENFAGRDD